MAFYAGVDRVQYPGDRVMGLLRKNTNLRWCGLYLQYADWQPKYGVLKDMGWGVAPVYGGKDPTGPKLSAIKARYAGHEAALKNALYDNGSTVDGTEAIAMANSAHIKPPTIIYFDIENPVPDAGWLAYYQGWCRKLVDEGYGVGLYTREAHATWLFHQLMTQGGFNIIMPTVWIAGYTHANPNGAPVPEKDYLSTPLPALDPTNSWSGASLWQHMGNMGVIYKDDSTPPKTLKLPGVDYNTSIYPDPGMGILSL
jgi:hypothetical protein